MKNFKKALRLFGLGLMLVLATLGVGLGGTPLVITKKREDINPVNIELVVQTKDTAEENDAKEIKP
jgi:hypothetical protein